MDSLWSIHERRTRVQFEVLDFNSNAGVMLMFESASFILQYSYE